MLRGLTTVSFWADDVIAARDWYAEVERRLEAGEPLFELDDEEPGGGERRLGAAG